MSIRIQSLKGIDYNQIFKAFSEAFADYEMQLNKEQLQTMLVRRGFNADLSFAAFDGERIVAFTLNGLGDWLGQRTAYDTGTGTIKAYRGKGLATRIFEYSIPYLKKANITQYLLEVLQHNTKAVSVYSKLGFEVSREFNYYVQDIHQLNFNTVITIPDFSIQNVDIDACANKVAFRDFIPSWQNSFDAINRKPDDFLILGGIYKQQLVAYCIFEPVSGDVTQIAVDPQYRRRGIGTLLLSEVLKTNQGNAIKVINTEVRNLSISHFLEANNIKQTGKQFEMIKLL